ncbi:MAG: dehydrogenase, partial [Pirellulaceae bacterium]|nr:dehydrogenase [Pirellulaceae bacterium]
MFRRLIVIAAVLLMLRPAMADDWPQWRGPEGNNHAAEGTDIPLRWNLTRGTNIHWKVKLPGRGHSTPIVIGDGVFMTTADTDKQIQSLLKVDRETGLIVDQWV